MKITQVTVRYGRKINLGNYNEAEIAVEYQVVVNEGESASTITDEVFAFAKEKVKAIVLPLVKPPKEKNGNSG